MLWIHLCSTWIGPIFKKYLGSINLYSGTAVGVLCPASPDYCNYRFENPECSSWEKLKEFGPIARRPREGSLLNVKITWEPEDLSTLQASSIRPSGVGPQAPQY